MAKVLVNLWDEGGRRVSEMQMVLIMVDFVIELQLFPLVFQNAKECPFLGSFLLFSNVFKLF